MRPTGLCQLDKVSAHVHWPIGSEEAQSDETMCHTWASIVPDELCLEVIPVAGGWGLDEESAPW